MNLKIDASLYRNAASNASWGVKRKTEDMWIEQQRKGRGNVREFHKRVKQQGKVTIFL